MGIDGTTEQRWSERKPLVLEVAIYHHGLLALTCRTRNIGLEGLFVELAGQRFAAHTAVEVGLPWNRAGREWQRIPALVVHNVPDGMGLMFCSFDHRLFQAIEHLVYTLPTDNTAARSLPLTFN